jgi:hypothetical protein
MAAFTSPSNNTGSTTMLTGVGAAQAGVNSHVYSPGTFLTKDARLLPGALAHQTPGRI